ncbi:DgyrCDS4840 [Dimorphilus gyrociliatus]|uniref:DgyrCDS4840 n=1 Tax=Dimorphilus gyrociliatus TaxID=2664684 RepID=A0A7I8VI58_9ANNE|nr:DgyrCDS4840 [Dimorphilus gyrociliatus]
MSSLTAEQKKRIEENRQKALAKRAQRESAAKSAANTALTKDKLAAIEKNRQNALAKRAALEARVSKSNSTQLKLNFTPSTGKSTSGQSLSKFGSNPQTRTSVELSLKSDDRFVATFGYDSSIINILKEIPSKLYDQENRVWTFHLSDHSLILEKLSKHGYQVKPLPKWIVKTFPIKDENITIDLSCIEEKLLNTLMPFQREGVEFVISKNGRGIIADEMGLGKTIQAITLAIFYKSEWPLLVITPSSVRFSWKQQILQWYPSLDKDDINVAVSAKDDPTKGLVNIVSYDLMIRHKMDFIRQGFKVVIVDECHLIKNNKAMRTQIAMAVIHQAKRAILLSGTPALSRPAELYTQIAAVRQNLFSSFPDFAYRYCDAKQSNWGLDTSGSSNLGELQILLERTIMIRRLKRNVMDQLPAKTRQLITLDNSAVKIDKRLKEAKDKLKVTKNQERRGAIMEYFRATGAVKIKAITQYVSEMLEMDKKFIIFAHHQVILDAIENSVVEKERKYIRIDGSTNPEQRHFFVQQFQNDDSVRVAILSITAANSGLNLTAASLVIFSELFWNPGILVQAEDRAHRIGQKDCVNIQYLVAENTADDLLWPMIQKKLNILGEIGLTKENFSSASRRDVGNKQNDLLNYFETDFLTEENSTADKAKPDEQTTSKSEDAKDVNRWLVDDEFDEIPESMLQYDVEPSEKKLKLENS